MDVKEILTRLDYVGELLQILQYHLNSCKMHDCRCDVCGDLRSFQRCCMKRASQEVGIVSSNLRSTLPASDGYGEPSLSSVLGRRGEGNGKAPAPFVMSSTRQDSGHHATAVISDCSPSPIYAAEGDADCHQLYQVSLPGSKEQGQNADTMQQQFREKLSRSSEQYAGSKANEFLGATTRCRSLSVPRSSSDALKKQTVNSSTQGRLITTKFDFSAITPTFVMPPTQQQKMATDSSGNNLDLPNISENAKPTMLNTTSAEEVDPKTDRTNGGIEHQNQKESHEDFDKENKLLKKNVSPLRNLLSSLQITEEDPCLKCMSNLGVSPRKSLVQDTVKSTFQKPSLSKDDHGVKNCSALDPEPKDSKIPTVLLSPQKLPTMGVRRSLELGHSNRNNNTSNASNQERGSDPIKNKSMKWMVVTEKMMPCKKVPSDNPITKSNDRNVHIPDIEPMIEGAQLCKVPQPVWGAPALSASQYLCQSPAKTTHTNIINNEQSQRKALCGTSKISSPQPEIQGINQTIPVNRLPKIRCHMVLPSSPVKANTIASDSVVRHPSRMIMNPVDQECQKHQSERNMSLPLSLLNTGAHSQELGIHKPARIECFEGNQSFPLSRYNGPQDCLPAQGLSTPSQKSLLDKGKVLDKRRNNFGNTGRTPRSRASIFGFSPPDQHCLSDPEGGQDGCPVDGPAALWNTLDVSMMLTQNYSSSPSLREILFNSVTSCLCVVDKRRSGKIVTVNESLQLLIGVHERVVGQRLLRFLKFNDNLDCLDRSIPQSFIRADGSVMSVRGVLGTCVDGHGTEHPVSVWMLPVLSQPNLAMCVVDVVSTFTSEVSLLREGQVVSLTGLFDEMLGLDLDSEGRVQCRLSGFDVKEAVAQQVQLKAQNFELPVTLVIESVETEPAEDGEIPVYHGSMSLCGNLCGLLVVQPDGHIIISDDYFRIFLGYSALAQQAELWEIISGVTKLGQVGDESTLSASGDQDVLDCSSLMQGLDLNLRDVSELRPVKTEEDTQERPNLCLPLSCFQHENSTFEEVSSENLHEAGDVENCCDDEVDEGNIPKSRQTTKAFKQSPGNKKWTPPKKTSTPYKGKTSSRSLCQETGENPLTPDVRALEPGIYRALFLHANGDQFYGFFKVGSILTSGLDWQFCVWVYLQTNDEVEENSWHSSAKSESGSPNPQTEQKEAAMPSDDSDDEVEDKDEEAEKDFNITVDPSLGQMIVDHAGLNQSHNAATGEDILDLETAIAGAFRKNYFVREALGQGSFGFVRRAMAIDCKRSVVVKFIKKGNMFSDGWTVNVDSGQKIPLEVAILKDLDSDYIIKVLDVYQNTDFVQMVMEDFGDVDLFDFIDQVSLDESLACHLFRQVLWGVEFLHSHGIAHRDIKDENVVLRSDFRCKLIDFGSAVYLLPGEGRFTKFRGTMEYCSPEVFSGASYHGPELDMWALGVTLYTMVYRVNPFNVEDMPDTFSQLKFPDDGDNEEPLCNNWGLLELMCGLLDQDPVSRYTMAQALRSEWLQMNVDISLYSWDHLFGN